jgi:prolyl 3-hydroxylase /prolyl 3,4-dihydroxylase
MKRKHNDPEAINGKGNAKKRAISDDEAKRNFRQGLFDSDVLRESTSQYAASKPYGISNRKAIALTMTLTVSAATSMV